MHNGVEFDEPTLDERDQPKDRQGGTLKVTDILVHNALEKIIKNIYELVAPKRQQELNVAHAVEYGLGILFYQWFVDVLK